MEPDSAVEAVPCDGFASLPRLLALDIFARLPADARLPLALVSPSWRALVAEPSLWACVDLSEGSGVTRASDALLLACSAKARGGMRSLNVCGRVWPAQMNTPENERPPLTMDALKTTLRGNTHSLRHLRALCPPLGTGYWKFLNGHTGTAVLDDVFRAAPKLTRVEVDISVAEFDASFLRNGVVSVRRLFVNSRPEIFSAFLVNARRCLSLTELELQMRLGAPEIEALLDFALIKPLTALSLIDPGLTPAVMPSLTRLLSGGSLTTLDVWNERRALTTPPAVCAAIAAAPLVRFRYAEAGLFDVLTPGLLLLAAVTGHPTLRRLCIHGNPIAPAECPAVGAALELLVAADSPLVALEISYCDQGMTARFLLSTRCRATRVFFTSLVKGTILHSAPLRVCWLRCGPQRRSSTSTLQREMTFPSCWRRRRWWLRAQLEESFSRNKNTQSRVNGNVLLWDTRGKPNLQSLD